MAAAPWWQYATLHGCRERELTHNSTEAAGAMRKGVFSSSFIFFSINI